MHEPNATPVDYLQQIRQWQAQRLAYLLAPSGWLSLTGFGWLKPGDNRIGSAAENDIVFQNGPAHLGVVTLKQSGEVSIRLAADSNAKIDGKSLRESTLFDDACIGQAPSIVSFGTASFHVIHRDGRKALRVKDDEAPARAHFSGLDYFAIDPAWRVIADWIPFATPCKLSLNRRLGTVSAVDVPGKAVFWLLGRMHALLPYLEKPGGDLFFVLTDQTSGEETCDKARFLHASPPVSGKLVLDFNKAHNPPSAFTPYANCPMAPPENELALRVIVGEKRYRGRREP
ncbi:DUF1684 domain-containing protein [Rhodanobacter sp. Col0626]|uniref:DUF1684 domain-containing protein n=1 Tax=Rhodanobacter sp. Col0626 TaxID=3415679 RepID=UPI003CF95FD6